MSNPLKRVMIPLMLRWLALAALLFSVPAQAQVFKPGKTGSSSSGSSSKSSAKSSGSSAKKSSSKKTASKKSSKKKKDTKADEEPKVDPDYVKITDDDE